MTLVSLGLSFPICFLLTGALWVCECIAIKFSKTTVEILKGDDYSLWKSIGEFLLSSTRIKEWLPLPTSPDSHSLVLLLQFPPPSFSASEKSYQVRPCWNPSAHAFLKCMKGSSPSQLLSLLAGIIGNGVLWFGLSHLSAPPGLGCECFGGQGPGLTARWMWLAPYQTLH